MDIGDRHFRCRDEIVIGTLKLEQINIKGIVKRLGQDKTACGIMFHSPADGHTMMKII